MSIVLVFKATHSPKLGEIEKILVLRVQLEQLGASAEPRPLQMDPPDGPSRWTLQMDYRSRRLQSRAL
jgi:hypothetical protein